MSQSSAGGRPPNPRVTSLQNGRHSREPSRQRRKSVSYNDAYLYALRVAYLSYLLQPRSKRKRHVPAKPSVTRTDTSASFNELMRDFSRVRDSKSTRYPHDFVKELEKRLQGILIGRERRQEYQDAVVKRTFAVFLNQLSDPGFKKRMEQDRRAEDLVLIFFSNATKELQKGKAAGDDAVKTYGRSACCPLRSAHDFGHKGHAQGPGPARADVQIAGTGEEAIENMTKTSRDRQTEQVRWSRRSCHSHMRSEICH